MMDQMIESNNFGVAFLEGGNLSQAVIFFRKVLQLAAEQVPQGMHRSNGYSFPRLEKNECLRHLARHLESSMLTSNSTFAHTHGFNILPDVVAAFNCESNSSVLLVTIISCTALFNLGLAHHIQSLTMEDNRIGKITSGSNSDIYIKVTMLKAAHKMYNICKALLEATGIQNLGSTGCVNLDLLYMALLNNLTEVTIESYYNLNDVKTLDDNIPNHYYAKELMGICSSNICSSSSSTPCLYGGEETLVLMKKKFLQNALISLHCNPETHAAHAA